ncbi:type VI secretion system lipoprotein TssJ [Enterovibrio norvegicus]|uniref:Type VI secretion system lipoprotein TssJ n=1 Tax=Enterovibrio norvegicus TaxID=188144 RepID=A0ABV4L5I7_9GAMM|nr:type VI secretion system lipoprotein TssJ [Enterovibrio norvegicus]OEF56347.1 type VI secretion system-associated lipoprotein [Enterovibrio norvegicus]
MKYTLLAMLLFGLTACSSSDELAEELPPSAEHPNQMLWTKQKSAVSYHIQADERLNVNNDAPTSLMLCVYQLTDSAEFVQFSQSEQGVRQLLECERFGPSVAFYQRLYLQPGLTLSDVMDRHEAVRFLAVVAGYWNLDTKNVTQLYAFPTDYTTTGSLLWETDHYRPGKLAVRLKAGEQSLWSETETE